MPAPRRTNAQLEAENAALRRFFFDLDLSRENSNLQAQLATLQAALPPPSEPYIALKAADHHGHHTTTLLRLAQRGLIDAKQEGSRWFVRQSSLTAYFNRQRGRQT
jgi:hypothetical protein